ncbi:DUF4430 domain-containing protein [Patescibacteria group bacterium]|nr:MAG: DUF4430 domain-containing protein [Patescibacteria group bacterium]
MKNAQKIILGIIGIIIVAVIGIWGLTQNPASVTNNTNVSSANINANANSAAQIQTSLQIDRQDSSTVKVFSVKMEKDSTALAQLQKVAADNNIPLEIKTESFGSYVDSLDGLKGGTDGKYWMYSVNGKTAEVGADQYKLAEGDVAEWKFTK